MAGGLPPKGRSGCQPGTMRKIKEVLRLKLEVGLGLRQIARSCAIGLEATHTSIYSGPKLPRSHGRLDPSGMMTDLKPRCSADRHVAAQRCCPCPTSPIFIASATSTRNTAVAVGGVSAGKPGWLPLQPLLRSIPAVAAETDFLLRQEHKAGEKLFGERRIVSEDVARA